MPIVIYNIENYYKKLIEMLDYAIETNFGKENYRETYKIFDNLDEIFSYYVWTDQAAGFYKKLGFTYKQEIEKNEGGHGQLFYKNI